MAIVVLTELNNSTIHKTSGKIIFILLQREKRKLLAILCGILIILNAKWGNDVKIT